MKWFSNPIWLPAYLLILSTGGPQHWLLASEQGIRLCFAQHYTALCRSTTCFALSVPFHNMGNLGNPFLPATMHYPSILQLPEWWCRKVSEESEIISLGAALHPVASLEAQALQYCHFDILLSPRTLLCAPQDSAICRLSTQAFPLFLWEAVKGTRVWRKESERQNCRAVWAPLNLMWPCEESLGLMMVWCSNNEPYKTGWKT